MGALGKSLNHRSIKPATAKAVLRPPITITNQQVQTRSESELCKNYIQTQTHTVQANLIQPHWDKHKSINNAIG